MPRKIYFSNEEKTQMAEFFENGMILSDIAEIFGYSVSTIRKNLLKVLSKEKHREIAKDHLKEGIKKAWEASAKLPRSEKQLKAVRENIKKAQEVAHSLPRSPNQLENLKKMHSLPRSENQFKAARENLKKAHNLPRSEKQKEQLKKVTETLAKGIWISNSEHRFFLMCLTKMFFLKDIKRQFYLEGLNHAFDFAIPSQKLLFEIDGDYWHSRPGRNERDIKIDNFAKSEGWFVLRFNDAKLKELGVI